MGTTVEREHCVLHGTDLVCAICEAHLGETHDGWCDRYRPEPTQADLVARGIPFSHYCRDCGRSFASQSPHARYCVGCATKASAV